MNDAPDRDVAIFTGALQLPTGERAGYLERACGGDDALRARVEALLQGHEQVGDFLERSPHETTEPGKPSSLIGEKPGDRVGRYKLLQQIGEGGCGVVYMAKQDEPVRRRVALKIIKPGMDTKSVIARFEAERQALALMNHPGIAKIFDAGATESGRPYFVMELVRGVKITEYCNQHSLTTEERLNLFVQVCQAIQHAHQKGIIHRDIKPSNILVTTNLEGARLPVVIDFGIAKATTNQRLTDKTIFTAFEMLIGTPAYMSPEQAELTSVDVDTRTDIYSLGVLLYELLTGSTPFDTRELMKGGLDEIRQMIREREPILPSTHLSKMTAADLATVAQSRKSEPSTLIHDIYGDLDWITMKALEKDRARRYETAYGMALDIQRHLDNEPVLARPTGTIYRVRKLIRRNKLVFAAGAAVVTMLLLGLAASLWQARRAVAAEHQATARAAAERAAREESEVISKYMIEIFQSPDPTRDGLTITVADTLDRAAKKLETDLTNQPDRRATLQRTLAVTYEALGLEGRAIPLRERIIQYDQETLGLERTNTLADMGALADSYLGVNRLEEAINLQEKVLTLRRKVNGPEGADTLVAMAALANSYFAANRRDEALKLREEVLTLSQKLYGVVEDPVTRAAMDKVALSYSKGGMTFIKELEMREEVLTLGSKVKDGREDPVAMMMTNILVWSSTNLDVKSRQLLLEEQVRKRNRNLNDPIHAITAAEVTNLAWSSANLDVMSRQIILQEQLRKLSGNVNVPEHPMTEAAMNNQADADLAAGKWDEAIKLKEEVLALRQKMSGPEHPDTLIAMNKLALAYFTVGRRDDSIKMQEDALDIMERAEGPTHPETLTAMMDLSTVYFVTGRIDKAVKLGEELLKRERQVLDPERPSAVYRMVVNDLANFYAAAGRHDEARKMHQEAEMLHIKDLEDALALSLRQDPNSPATAELYKNLGFSYDLLGNGEKAIKYLQEAVRIDPTGDQEAAYLLGKSLVDRKRYVEALPILRATHKFYPDGDRGREAAERLAVAEAMAAGRDPLPPFQQIVAPDPTNTYEAKQMATVYLWLGRTNEHEAICRKLLDLTANSKDPTACDRAAKAYLIQPHPDPETLKRAVASGRRALELATTNDSSRGWYLITAAMALVRDGEPAEAEILLNEEIKAEPFLADRHRLALCYRALARAHLGRTEEARADFAGPENVFIMLPVPPELAAIFLEPDELAAGLAHEEARVLLNLPPPPSKP